MTNEAWIILITVYIIIGGIFSIKYYLDEVKGKDVYLNDLIIILLCIIAWPALVIGVNVCALVIADEIVIWRRK